MSTVVKAERIAEASPRFKARIAGVLYALEGTASVFGGVYFRSKFLVSGDAAATANNLVTNQPLLWAGFAVALLAVAFHITYTVLFYELFRPVSRTISLLAAFVSVVACALAAGAALFQVSAWLVVGGGSSVSAYTGEQAQNLAFLLLNMNVYAFYIYLIFFGFWLIPTGYLILRSAFFPRVIGVFLMLDGVGWVTYLVPPFANSIYSVIAIVAALGEIPLLLWLLIFGVNNQRWKEQAGAAKESLSI